MTAKTPTQQEQLHLQMNNYLAQALTTADEKAFDHAYLIPGIVGEVGELFGQHAKAHWHTWTAEALQEQLIKEYGDIAWMTALLMHVEVAEGRATADHKGLNLVFSTRGLDDPMHLLLMRATALHLYYTMDMTSYLAGEAARIWAALAAQCQTVTGVDFQVVLDTNIAKLASRAARGVLKGQGDNR